MTPITREQAIAFAVKNGITAVFGGVDEYLATSQELANFLTDFRQQVIADLAQRSGAMPQAWLEDRGDSVCDFYEVQDAIYSLQAQLEKSEARVRELEKDAAPDMFWNSDDAERQHYSIAEFLNDEICNGSLDEVGAVFTIWQAKKLPSVKIRVTAIDEESCEAEYEIIDAALNKEPGNEA